MTHVAPAFPKMWTVKYVVRQVSKKSSFSGPFNKQHGKCNDTLLKFERHHLYHIYWPIWSQLSSKTSLGLFVNRLTAAQKYSLINRDNLTQPVEMQFSLKLKTFSKFFFAFSKCRLNFEHFEKKMTLKADAFWKLRKLSWKKSILVIYKFLRLFVNTLTARGKYSLRNRGNLSLPIETQLSLTQKTFSQFFLHFWNLA